MTHTYDKFRRLERARELQAKKTLSEAEQKLLQDSCTVIPPRLKNANPENLKWKRQSDTEEVAEGLSS